MEVSEEKEPFVYLCPECAKPIDVSAVSPFAKIECPHCSAFVRARTTMGQYQIVGLLGEGGMSQVFRAIDMNLGREVALKILHQSLSDDSALTSMFEREAKLTASIVHPNVVKVFTVGKDHGYFFIAMEVVNAISLEQLIHNKGALSESEVLSIANDVTRGLMAAYSEELIHRDIKPGNMLVCVDGTTKLVDFGLAVQQGGEDESEDLWATPFYVPPEKLDGQPDTFLGDIYSLGATLFHALAGRAPFEANTASMEELKEIKKSVVDLKSFAPGLSKLTIKLVEKMMAYDPAARPQSYEEVLQQLEEIQKRLFGIVPGGRRREGKSRKGWGIVAGGVLAAAALATGFYVNHEKSIEGEEGELGLGTNNGERVISVGENTLSEQFLNARGLFTNGKFPEAGKAFDELIARESVPSSIQLWSHFLRGTIHLISGEEGPSREAFSRVMEITPGPEEDGTADAVAFLKKASSGLLDPLPLLEEDVKFPADSIESLGMFTAGLKNWQAGQFESAVKFFSAFAASQPPSAYEWIGALKPRVDPFLSDFKILQGLPNPSATGAAAVLADQEKALKDALASLATAGAAPERVNDRLSRIAGIRKLAADLATKRNVASSAAPVSTNSTAPKPPLTPPVADPVEAKEIAQIKALSLSLQAPAGSFRFTEGVTGLQSQELTSAKARAIRAELVAVYENAGQFINVLVMALNTTRYEGLVRRREGVPLDAAITAASPASLILDLGFGPNEVAVDLFAPDWLLEAGMKTFPPVTPETADDWEKLVSFGIVIGKISVVESRARELAGVDSDFRRRWELIQEIQ